MPLNTTVEEAELLKVSPRFLRRMVSRGEAPAYRCGRQLRFDHQAVLAALQNGEENPEPDWDELAVEAEAELSGGEEVD